MSSNSSETALAGLVAIGILIALGIWWFAKHIGVDFETAGIFLAKSAAFLVVAYLVSRFLSWPMHVILSLLGAALVFSFLPILDYWSAQETQQFGVQVYEVRWFARWYSEAVFVLTPLAIGFLWHRR